MAGTLGILLAGGQGERLGLGQPKALALLGGGAFLPIHWGTFSLAMHAWDQPAEVLFERGPRSGVQLVMTSDRIARGLIARER